MAFLEHDLQTIELGSINWRNVLNYNFNELDTNRTFTVNAINDLPTSNFKSNRFFYCLENKKTYFDNGIELLESGGGGGSEIDFANNPNKFLRVNYLGTALDYVSLDPSMFLQNQGGGYNTLSVNSNPNSHDGSFISAFGYLNRFSQSGNSTLFGYGNTLGNNSNFTNVIGNENQTQFGCNFTNIFGYQNGSIKTNNIVIGNQNTVDAYYCKIFGDTNDIHASYNTIFGSSITNYAYSNIVLFGDSYNPQNSHSFIKKINNSVNINTKIRKQNLNTNYLAKVYIKESSAESLYVYHNSLINLKGKINFFNSSNQTCKILNVQLIATVNGAGIVSLKHLHKEDLFKDTEYNGADIDFDLSQSNKIILLANTHNVNTLFVADFDIEFIM